MFLQNKIKIREEEAKKLIQILDKKTLLTNIQNSNFLCKDLESLKENYSNQKDALGKRIGPISKNLGSFVSPDYGIKSKHAYEEYARYLRAGEIQDLQFLCGPSVKDFDIVPGVLIYVMDNNKQKIQFCRGGWGLQNLRSKEFKTDKIIFELASFFHNRKDLYIKIREILTENLDEFESITTPAFIKDLILLFSAEDNSKEIKDFNLDFGSMEERRVYSEFIHKDKIWVERMVCHLKRTSGSKSYFVRLLTEVWLDRKNTLIFNTYEEDYNNPKIKIETYSGVKDYLKDKAKDMLKQLVSSTNFQIAIFEQVKTKILLDSL